MTFLSGLSSFKPQYPSTCLHEVYSIPELIAHQANMGGESMLTTPCVLAPLYKSIRKLLLSKSTPTAQKSIWKKAGNWEGIIEKGLEDLFEEIKSDFVQDFMMNSNLAVAFNQLINEVSTPMHLCAILLDNLNGATTFDDQIADHSRWGKGIYQIIKILETNAEMEKYLPSESDAKRRMEIEDEWTRLMMEVKTIESEMKLFTTRSAVVKGAIEKLDDELSKLNLNSNPAPTVHPSAASSSKARSISTTAPVPTPVSTPAPPTKKRRISNSDEGSPGEFLGEKPAVILSIIVYKMVTSCDSEVRDAMDIIARERPDLCNVSFTTTNFFSALMTWHLCTERNSIR
jgi:hypothetical protein